jgi:hypothetical protein
MLMALWPSVVFGQAQRAGVVTILEGQATVKRVALPDPIPLKFKDDVFVRDRVETGEKSLVRMLLGGAALVTIRARSVATITEIPGKSTINLDSGKISLAVARDKLRPGDSLEIRTVNAVAAIRGTVVVAEVHRASSDAASSAQQAVTTNFHVLRGTIAAHNLDPTTGAPLTTPQPVSAGQSFTAAGTGAPTVGPNPPVAVVTSGLTPGQPQHAHAANGTELSAQAVEMARLLVQSLIGPVPGDTTLPSQGPVAFALPPTFETLIQAEPVSLISLPRLNPGGGDFSAVLSPPSQISGPGGTVPPPAGGPPAAPTTFSLLPGLAASSVLGPFVQAPPAPLIVLPPSGQALVIPGAAIEVPSGDSLTLDRSLLAIFDRVVSMGSLLSVPGALASTTPDVLVAIDPSVVNTAGSLISVPGAMSLAGALMTDVSGTFNIAADLLTVTGQLNSIGSDALLGFADSLVNAGVDPVTSATAAGRLVNLAGTATSPATLSISGSLVAAVDSAFVTTSEGLRVASGGILTQSGTSAPLLLLTGGSITSGADLVQVSGLSSGGALPTRLILSGSLLDASNLDVNVGGNLIGVANGATLTSHGAAPVVSSQDSVVVVGGHFVGLSNGGRLTTGTELLETVGGQVTVASDLVSVVGGSGLTVADAPLLRMNDTTLAIGGRLIAAEGDLAVVKTVAGMPPPNSPLLALDFSHGGHLTVGTTVANAIVARGFTTQSHVDPDFGTIPSLGTDRPIVHQGGGPLLDVRAARTDTTVASFDVDVTGSGIVLDTALLQASAPLIGLTRAAMKTSADSINLFQHARLETGTLVRLDRSRLDVVSGNLVSISGGSLLQAQNLLTVANGSRVNIQNGALLSVLGSSFANIGGCLVCFTGSNNVVTVTNSIPSTGSLFGFPIAGTVQVGAGATAASVFPGLGANGNQLNVTGVLVNVGAGSTLKLQ